MFSKNKSCINDIEIILRTLLNTFLFCENMNLNFDQLTILCYEFIIFFKDSDKYIGENLLQKQLRESNIETSKTIRRNLTSNLFFSLRTPKLNIVVPDCIYEGLNYFNVDGKNNSLLKTWKDFPIYEKIIKYYSKKIWGLDKMCKAVKESPKKKLHELYLKLIKEYTENKNYKNMLYQDLSILLNINNNNNKEKHSINILNINAQLLSIAYTLSFDDKERQKIEQYINHFILYCVIASNKYKPNRKRL